MTAALGAPDAWPPHLSTTLALADALPIPSAIAWGPELLFAPSASFAGLALSASLERARPLATFASSSPLFAALLEPAHGVFRDGAAAVLPRTEVKAHDGATRWISVALAPIRAPGASAASGVLLVANDETAAAEAEGRVASARRELYDDFEQMFGVAAHDLKNPLNVISLSSYQLGMLPLPPELKERTKRLTDAVKRSMRRIDDLLNDLLDLAHLDVGPLVLDRAQHDANKLMDEALEYLVPLAKHKNVVLDAKVDPALTLFCDKARFLRLVVNLVTEAIAATPEHGMVRLTALGDGDRVLFEVHDMGPGIAAADLPRVFDRRAVRRKDLRPKAGRSLPLAKSLVEAQGGKLSVESPPGLGTLVRFSLPTSG